MNNWDSDQHVREAEDGWIEMQRQADEDRAAYEQQQAGGEQDG